MNFGNASTAEALLRDINSLGYRARMEFGTEWLRRRFTPRAEDAHLLLLNGSARHFPASETLELMGRRPFVCVVYGCDAGDCEHVIRAATDFLQAPWTRRELAIRIDRFLADHAAWKRAIQPDLAGLEIVGSAPDFLACLAHARRAASSAAPVVIGGETGVGKELFAKLVHRLSDRARRPFVPVNCGCLPPELVENELFGHEAGAFTGATRAHGGLVKQAEGGTLFLDEVDALSPRAQVALLRFLQEGEVRPVGGGKLRWLDVRVIAAANRALRALVASSDFREDLYFRLCVLELRVPPLRERREDIPALAQHLLARRGAAYGRPRLALSAEAETWIVAHDWPGNVRQLDNVIHRAVVTAEGPIIRLSDVAPPQTAPPRVAQGVHFAAAKAQAVNAFERRYLSELMREAAGNVTAAAARAGKERRALGKLLKKHGIGAARFRTT